MSEWEEWGADGAPEPFSDYDIRAGARLREV